MQSKLLLLFLILVSGALISAHAQPQNWEAGVTMHRFATDESFTNYNRKLFILGVSGRGHVSLLDLLMNSEDRRLRLGDYLGTGFQTGYANETRRLNSGEIKELKTMWLNLDLQLGLQGAFAVTDQLTVGLHGFKEFQFNWVVMGDGTLSRFLNVAGGYLRYGRIWASYDHGWNWKADRTGNDGWDKTSRVNLRLLLGDKGNYLGFRADWARRYWETNPARVDRQPSFSVSFGRNF